MTPRAVTGRAVGLLLLLAVTAVAPTPAAVAEESPEPVPWWDDRWRLRVPVTVEGTVEAPLSPGPVPQGGKDVPVQWTLDVAEHLRNRGLLDGSTARFDPESVQVVEARRGDEGWRLQPVPTRFDPGSVLDGSTPGPYTPSLGPGNATYGTVTWLMPNETEPGQTRRFHAYLDLEDGDDATRLDLDPATRARFESLHWKHPAHVLYTNLPVGEDTRVLVTATRPNTTVQVTDLATGERWLKAPRTLDAGRFLEIGPTSTEEMPEDHTARVVATKPVLAAVATRGTRGISDDAPTYFLPTTSGGLSGTRFLFSAHDIVDPTPALHAIAGENATTVTVYGRDGEVAGQRYVPGGNVADLSELVDTSSHDASPMRSQRIETTEPILLQAVGHRSAVQLPTLEGAPVGRHLVGAAGPEVTYYAEAEGTAELRPRGGIDPSVRDRAPLAPGALNATRHYLDNPPDVSLVEATAPASLLSTTRESETDDPTREVVFVGGRNARHVQLDLRAQSKCGCPPAAVFAFYDDTRVRVTETRMDPFGEPQPVTREVTLTPGEPLMLNRTGPVEVHADKPVGVQWNDDPHYDRSEFQWDHGFVDYLPGRRLSPRTTADPLEVRGCVPRLTHPDGQPARQVTAKALPGETVQVPLRVENVATVRNRSDVDALSERFNLSTADTFPSDHAAFKASISPRNGSEDPGGQAWRFTVEIDVPTEASEAPVAVPVEATCRNAPGLSVETTVLVLPTLDGPFNLLATGTEGEVGVPAGGSRTVPVTLVHATPEARTVGLSATLEGPARGWSVELTPAKVTLDGRERRNLLLEIQAPEDGGRRAQVRLEARDPEDPSVHDAVGWTAHAIHQAALDLDAQEPRRTVEPGDAARHRLVARNHLDEQVELRWTVHGSLPDGWDRRLSEPGPTLVAPDGEATTSVIVDVPGGAPADRTVDTRVRAWTRNDTGSWQLAGERSLETVVASVTEPRLDLLSAGTEDRSATVELMAFNAGSQPLDGHLTVQAPGLAWRFAPETGNASEDGVAVLHLDPGQRRTVAFHAPPADVPPGRHTVRASLVGADGTGRADAEIPLTVDRAFEVALNGPRQPVEVDETGRAATRIELQQTGTVETNLTFEVDPPWRLVQPTGPFPLSPGRASLDVVLALPEAPSERSVPPARITLLAPDGDRVANATISTTLTAPSLAIRDARLVPDEHGRARLEAVVANEGDRIAEGLTLSVTVDGDRLGAPPALERLPAGQARSIAIPLLEPLEDVREAEVTVALDNATAPGTNAGATATSTADRPTPTVTGWTVGLVLAAAAACGFSRRARGPRRRSRE